MLFIKDKLQKQRGNNNDRFSLVCLYNIYVYNYCFNRTFNTFCYSFECGVRSLLFILFCIPHPRKESGFPHIYLLLIIINILTKVNRNITFGEVATGRTLVFNIVLFVFTWPAAWESRKNGTSPYLIGQWPVMNNNLTTGYTHTGILPDNQRYNFSFLVFHIRTYLFLLFYTVSRRGKVLPLYTASLPEGAHPYINEE